MAKKKKSDRARFEDFNPEIPGAEQWKPGTLQIKSGFDERRPRFAFDFAAFEKSDFCFDSKLIDGRKEYVKMLEALKKISLLTFREIRTGKEHHFHEVNFEDTPVPVSNFMKCLGVTDDSQGPTVVQFKAFEEARIVGFIHAGIVYPVWFDAKHKLYPRK